MPVTLETAAVEGSTYVITFAFTDEDGTAVTPSAATWTLYDEDGAVVNSRQDVSLAPLASTKQIVLTGADLALDTYSAQVRRVVVEGTYDSSLGSGLSLREEITFTLQNLVSS